MICMHQYHRGPGYSSAEHWDAPQFLQMAMAYRENEEEVIRSVDYKIS